VPVSTLVACSELDGDGMADLLGSIHSGSRVAERLVDERTGDHVEALELDNVASDKLDGARDSTLEERLVRRSLVVFTSELVGCRPCDVSATEELDGKGAEGSILLVTGVSAGLVGLPDFDGHFGQEGLLPPALDSGARGDSGVLPIEGKGFPQTGTMEGRSSFGGGLCTSAGEGGFWFHGEPAAGAWWLAQSPGLIPTEPNLSPVTFSPLSNSSPIFCP